MPKAIPRIPKHNAFIIADESGLLAGIIARGDMFRCDKNNVQEKNSVEFRGGEVLVAYPDESLGDAVNRMLLNSIGRLPVVERAAPREVVGYLGRANMLSSPHPAVEGGERAGGRGGSATYTKPRVKVDGRDVTLFGYLPREYFQLIMNSRSTSSIDTYLLKMPSQCIALHWYDYAR